MLFTRRSRLGRVRLRLRRRPPGRTGLLLELAARRPGSIVLRAAAVAIGVAAIVFGEADDAPGLVLFGGLLIVGTVALAVRTALRSE